MKIVFLDEYSLGGSDLTPISSLGDYSGYAETHTAQEVIERCAEAEVIITNKVIINDSIMSQLPHLRLICVAATGVNNINLEAAAKRQIEVRNAVGYSTHSVAEATISMTLALLRQLPYYDNYVKSGDYSKSSRLFIFDRHIRELRGKRWGIIGLGNIGREVARLASAFGCDVRYHSTSGCARKEEYEHLSLDELLKWSNVISVHAPLNDHTHGLISARELSLMGSESVIINVARGGIICEEALAEALNSHKIAGAALDVFSQEPINSNSPLLTLNDPSQIILSTHNAWAAKESIAKLVETIKENIVKSY
ncbi:MAG: NAD(P)-dependent oxidoreductase [Rikenellaceae bacterium]